MSKSYFIVGANGQLGQALAERYPDATLVDRAEFDMTNPAEYDRIDWSGYDTIINAAAITNVDGAETPDGRKLCWAVNATAVGLLAKTAIEHDLTMVHVSSDYVFDGTQEPHLEDEAFAPLSVYGETKAAGDIATSIVPKHYILRTSWVIGGGKNFVGIMKELADKGVSPSVVNDQTGRLTFVSTLADAIKHLLDSGAEYGTYNCSNDGDTVSWADIAKLVFEKSGRNANDVTGVTTEEYYNGKEGIAPRPLKSTMSLDKLKASGFTPADWRGELEEYWNEMKENV